MTRRYPSDRALNVSISTSSCAWQLARIRLCAIPSSPDGNGESTLSVNVVGLPRPVTPIFAPDEAGRSAGQEEIDWPAAKWTSAFLPLDASVSVTVASPLLLPR